MDETERERQQAKVAEQIASTTHSSWRVPAEERLIAALDRLTERIGWLGALLADDDDEVPERIDMDAPE